jgi:hypothetical protein
MSSAMSQQWFVNNIVDARSHGQTGLCAVFAALFLLGTAAEVASAATEETDDAATAIPSTDRPADEASWLSGDQLEDDGVASGDFPAIEIVDDEFGEHIDSPVEVFVGPPIPEQSSDSGSKAKNTKPRVAANIDLSRPVAPSQGLDDIDIGMIAPPPEPTLAVYAQKSLMLLGAEVAASTSTRLAWSPAHSFAGIAAPTPVLVVNGAHRGPTLCMTAAIHGDELNGIEVVRRVL